MALIWQDVKIETVAQLGRFREQLRALPSIAAHVQSFTFTWDMNEEYVRQYVDFLKAFHQSLSVLDYAFMNRINIWTQTAESLGAEIVQDRVHPVTHDEMHGLVDEEAEEEAEELGHYETPYFTHSNRSYQKPNSDEDCSCSGPDGNGEDRFIKSSDDFNDYVSSILGDLASLNSFSWRCQVTSLPSQAFDALAKLTALKKLEMNMLSYSYGACE